MVNVPVRILHREEPGGVDFFDRVRDRAYELFRQRGCVPGYEDEDWLRAEREIMNGADTAVMETNRGYRLRCRLPGFDAERIRVRASAMEIVVEGDSEDARGELTIRNVYRRVTPAEPVDVDAVSARWDGEELVVDVAAPGLPHADGNGGVQDVEAGRSLVSR